MLLKLVNIACFKTTQQPHLPMISEIHSPDHLMRTSTPFIGGMWLQLMVNDRNGLQQSICLVKSTEYAVKDSIMV